MVNLTPHALLFTIAAIGVSETSYLIRKRIIDERPVCPIGEGCATVLNSKYNRFFFGIHNDVAGMAFYVGFAILIGALVIGTAYDALLLLLAEIMLAGAALMSLIFIYLQWRVIRAWCFWCLMSAATIGLMAIIMLTAVLV